MSIYDQQKLLASLHPFDLLGKASIQKLTQHMDIAYYPKETLLISPTIGSDHLYIIIKGCVYERLNDELHNVYNEGDSFDANVLIYDKTESTYVVQEDLICYLLPKEIFLNLIQDEKPFGAFFMKDFIAKHQSLKAHQQQHDLTPFIMTRVENIFLHPVCMVDETTSIHNALLKMRELHATAILVSSNTQGYGIITDADLREKVLIEGMEIHAPVKTIATFPLISIDSAEFLFNALLVFIKHGIKRLAITHEDEIIGLLEQRDLLSHFANHSHLVAIQVEKAKNIDELSKIQQNQRYMVESLHAKGVKVRYIAKLVNEINAKVFTKVYTLCVPEAYQDKAALIVMGSQGRQEQILHTDQDNALIIDNSLSAEEYLPWMQTFNESLISLGFPPCPGQIMANNPQWCQNLSGYKNAIDDWIEHINEETFQKLCIIADAQIICGDAKLLSTLKAHMQHSLNGHNDLLSHMAKAALSFETPLSLFSGFVLDKGAKSPGIDLKKGGVFALVHGIRILALEKGIETTNTVSRIKALSDMGIFDQTFATELIESFDTLTSIRLKGMLEHQEGLNEANYVDPSNLEKFERDLLKDSFKVVNTFKKFLTYHFNLNMVM